MSAKSTPSANLSERRDDPKNQKSKPKLDKFEKLEKAMQKIAKKHKALLKKVGRPFTSQDSSSSSSSSDSSGEDEPNEAANQKTSKSNINQILPGTSGTISPKKPRKAAGPKKVTKEPSPKTSVKEEPHNTSGSVDETVLEGLDIYSDEVTKQLSLENMSLNVINRNIGEDLLGENPFENPLEDNDSLMEEHNLLLLFR